MQKDDNILISLSCTLVLIIFFLSFSGLFRFLCMQKVLTVKRSKYTATGALLPHRKKTSLEMPRH